MRRPYSGHNDEDLVLPATDVRELISGADFDARNVAFWLRSLTIRNYDGANDTVVDIYDQDEGVAVAANQRLSLDIPAGTTAMFDSRRRVSNSLLTLLPQALQYLLLQHMRQVLPVTLMEVSNASNLYSK
jgi:hypothetical protein